MKIRSKKAYAIISGKNPTISVLHIFGDRDLTLDKGEQLLEVMIMPIRKVTPRN